MTAEATGGAPAGEAGFRLLAEQLPDIAVLAFDQELEIWAATGAAITEALCRAALAGACWRIEAVGKTEGLRL